MSTYISMLGRMRRRERPGRNRIINRSYHPHPRPIDCPFYEVFVGEISNLI